VIEIRLNGERVAVLYAYSRCAFVSLGNPRRTRYKQNIKIA